MKLLIKAKTKVMHPGIRGGKYWYDKKGEIHYGEKPEKEVKNIELKPAINRHPISVEEYKKHSIPANAKLAYYYENHPKYTHEWRDNRGRLQRRYRPEFVAQKQKDKYERINRAINRIPELREQVNNDLNGKDPMKKYTALAVKIIDITGARVGNEKYLESNETHGITTLEKNHLFFKGDTAILDYIGKKKVHQYHEITEPDVVEALRELKQMPGQRLFQINEQNNISSDDVNKYLKNYGLTAKDLRTFKANAEFTKEIMTAGVANEEKIRKKVVAKALKTVASKLGNTPNVCLTNYISHDLLENYLRGNISVKFALNKAYDIKDYDELFDDYEKEFIEIWSQLTKEDGNGNRLSNKKSNDDKSGLEKSHVKGHTRATKIGKIVYVKPYENKVVKKPEEVNLTAGAVINIPLDNIERDESQPREKFDYQSLIELGDSIKKIGLMQPIGVTPADKNGKHKIIFGERRWRASKLAGLTEIPARIYDIKDKKELYAIQVAENLARKDMNPIEEANAYKKLYDVGMSYDEIGKRVGVSPLSVQRKLTLTTLIPDIQNLVKNGDLTETNGILIGMAGLKPQYQIEVLKKIMTASDKLSREELDGIVGRFQQAQNQASLFSLESSDVITSIGQINKQRVEALNKQIAQLLGKVVKAAEKIINNKNYKLAPAVLKEQGKLARTKEELKLLQTYLNAILREIETADAFFHSGGTISQYLAKQNVKKQKHKKHKRMKKAIRYIIKSLVRAHKRATKTGKIVPVKQYINKKTKKRETLLQKPKPKFKFPNGGYFYDISPQQLRNLSAEQFRENDIIRVSKYLIHIKYGEYDTPALKTYITDHNFKILDCSPGYGTPYYIDEFKNKKIIGKRFVKSIFIFKGINYPIGHISIYKDGSVWKKVKNSGKPEDWKELKGAEKLRALKQAHIKKQGKTIRTVREEDRKIVQTEKVSRYNRTTSEKNKEHKDVGIKIGGAKKDIWAAKLRAGKLLTLADINQIKKDNVLYDKLIRKENILVKPNIEVLKSRGVTPGCAYLLNWLYSIIARIPDQEYKNYYPKAIDRINQMTSNLRTVEDFKTFMKTLKDNISLDNNIWNFSFKINEYFEDKDENKDFVERKILESLGRKFFENLFSCNRLLERLKNKHRSVYSYKLSHNYNNAYRLAADYQTENDWSWVEEQDKSKKKENIDFSDNRIKDYIKIIEKNKQLHDIAYWTAVNSPNAKGWEFSKIPIKIYIDKNTEKERENLIKYAKELNDKYQNKGINLYYRCNVNPYNIDFTYPNEFNYRWDRLKEILTTSEYNNLKQKYDKGVEKVTKLRNNIPQKTLKERSFIHPKWDYKTREYFKKEYGYDESDINPNNIFKKYGISDPEIFTKAAYKWRIDNIPNENIPEEMKRKGPATLGGDEKTLLKRFGLRGIEYGNYVDDESREYHSNQCNMAFADLSRILKISGKDISFNGRLAIGFGTRGAGKATATYHPDRKIINITKNRGGGSLAHEWMHFIDNIIGEQITQKNYEFASNQKQLFDRIIQIDEFFKNTNTNEDTITNPNLKINPLHRALKNVMDSIKYKIDEEEYEIYHGSEASSITKWPGIDKYIELSNYNASEAYKMIAAHYRDIKDYDKEHRAQLCNYLAMKCNEPCHIRLTENQRKTYSEYYQRSSRNGEYWVRDNEMLARAFEAYIYDKLKRRGDFNNYLVRTIEPKYYHPYFYPYPDGDERKAINNAFDELFALIRSNDELKKSIFERKI